MSNYVYGNYFEMNNLFMLEKMITFENKVQDINCFFKVSHKCFFNILVCLVLNELFPGMS